MTTSAPGSEAPPDRGAAPPAADPTARLTRRLRAVALLTGAVWSLVVLVWSEGPFALTFDDAYYYFEIASRLADGQGSTFDGIADTNGYHPLWLAISTIPFVFGVEGMAAVRVLLEVQVLIWVGALWVLAGTVGRAAAGWPRLAAKLADRADRAANACEWSVTVVFALIVVNPFVVRIAVNGLESILVVGLGVVLLDRVVRGPGSLVAGRDRRWTLGTAALLALLFLGRTDSVLLLATLGVAGLAEIRRRGLGRRGAVSLALLLGPAAAVVGAFSLANIAAFGGLQISGVVKRAPLDATSAIAFAAVVGLAVIAIVRSGSRLDRLAAGATPRFARASSFTARTSWYGAFAVLVVAYYSVLSVQQWLWYYAPAMLWVVTLALVASVDLFERGVVESARTASPDRALLPLRLIAVAPLLLLLVLQVRSTTDPELRSIQLANRDAGRWIDDNLPDDAVLASWDAGALAFFTERPVVNIDGVVNGFDWYDATQEGPAAVAAYLDRAGVTHIVNHGAVVDGEDPDIRPYIATLWGDDDAAAASIVEAVRFTFSGTTVGSRGRSSGTQDMAVWIYELVPPASR